MVRESSNKHKIKKPYLNLICSKHVDDLKGASTKVVFDQLCAKLKENFGDLTIQIQTFEHLGITHEKKPDFSVVCSQDHYVKQLRPMSLDSLPADERRRSPTQIFFLLTALLSAALLGPS